MLGNRGCHSLEALALAFTTEVAYQGDAGQAATMRSAGLSSRWAVTLLGRRHLVGAVLRRRLTWRATAGSAAQKSSKRLLRPTAGAAYGILPRGGHGAGDGVRLRPHPARAPVRLRSSCRGCRMVA